VPGHGQKPGADLREVHRLAVERALEAPGQLVQMDTFLMAVFVPA
jgi:hypothetical protein